MIGLDGIEACVLQLVSLQLRHQADAAALLIFVDHESAAFFGDGLHRHLAQRSDPNTSPVKHCEWMRSNGAPSVGSPRTSASAVSTRWLSFETSRSNPMASNMPHLVGIRVETTRQSISACAAALMFVRLAIL